MRAPAASAAVAVEPAAPVFTGAEQVVDIRLVEVLDGGAEPRPLRHARLHEIDRGCRMRTLDPAAAVPRHIHAVLLDQIEDDVGGAADELDQALPALGTEHADDLVWIVFEPRDHLAAVAAGGAPTGLVSLEHQRADAALGQVQRGREPGVAAADDADIGRGRFL